MAGHVCPWWMGYLLANPLRKLLENPERLLEPFVKEGMTVVDYGCAMGFFTLPLARLVGPGGKVIAVDLQQKMLDGMLKRAISAGVADRIVPMLSQANGVVIDVAVDFVAALHVVHELPDNRSFFLQMRGIMKPGAGLLMVEPAHHVSESAFQESVNTAESVGFHRTSVSIAGRGRRALLEAPVIKDEA